MNLFFKRLIGQLQSTERMERRMMMEEERIARYRQVEQSPELKEFLELKKIVESKEFGQKKYNLIHTKFKTTPTYETIRRYKDLLNNKQLQMYLELEDSQRLKDYLAFRSSPNYIKLQNKKEVRNSLELKQMAEFEKSDEFKAYLHYRDSKLPAQFKSLLAEVSSDEFKEQYAFWSNPKRWKTTDEYQQEVLYKRLSLMPDIVYYLKQDSSEIEKLEDWKKVFVDEFDWQRLSDSSWKAGFAYNNPKLLSQHSFVNEQQANNGGKNVGAMDGKLRLFTKNEKITAPAWDPKKGFINKDFDYTSDIIQTADKFRCEGGLFMAKIRIEGDIHHAFWLGSGKKLPMLSIFHYNGKRVTMGNYGENVFDGTTLRGINPRNYYIYSLRWTDRELVWYVNNVEVYRTSRNIPKEKLFLAFSSFIDEQQRAMEGQLNVAWVRVYQSESSKIK
ncbi:MAG: hypothetical protein K6A36_02300 [Paludibacteraceae bacterium]|nr:hypothetical protein [Paludibacteraceae bacterium]